MSLRLLILNCNNTLRESVSNPGDYINRPKDQRIIVGAANALRALDVTWSVILTHNDGGLTALNPETKKAFKTFPESIQEQRETIRLLRQIKTVKAVYVCPNFFGKGKRCFRVTARSVRYYDGTNFRLPGVGMLELGIAEYSNTKTQEIKYVGDQESDLEAAETLGINFQWAEEWWQ